MRSVVSAGKRKLFKNSKTTKRIVLVVFTAIFVLACYSVVSSYFMYCEQSLNRLDAIAKTLSVQIDGNNHKLLTDTYKINGEIKTNKENALYYSIQRQLKEVQSKNNLKSEISTLIYNDSLKQFFYVVNSSDKPYYLDLYSQNHEAFLKDYQVGGVLPQYKDEYGTWLTAISPIRNDEGVVVAIVEVDERYDDFIDVIDEELYSKIAIALIIFTIVAFVLLRYLRQILLAEETVKKELANSYEIINQHNEDMLNSINYAKKIQIAILPPLEVIQQNIPKSFVFYKPKDIVSGDFYFFKELIPQKKYVIAVCDCTGHGVPGALMSMIGNNFLEQIIDDDCFSPAEILTKLNRSVIYALKQDAMQSESRDGMDVSLCMIDIEKQTLTYAGANRPLYTVEGDGVFSEIKGDKRPIGGLDNSLFEFKEHTIDLKEHTNYYLFSDGYVDQFGGEKNKKFSTKRLKELLGGISKRTMNEQSEAISQAFIQWKTNNGQTDDVLFIGFQII
jgi:serine phosphatase RsbU (regulator of sigma subunit)